MVKEFPSVDDLLATVREFLQRIGPDLPASSKYDGQVAIYLLDIARREIADSARQTAAEDGTTALCAEIRSGMRDENWESTVQGILEETIVRARIVRPSYLAAEHVAVAS